MKDSYTKEKGIFNRFEEEDDSSPHKLSKNSNFHIGQDYVDTPIPKIECIKCGGDKFEVGTAGYFTGIRCPSCGWECCIHEG